MDNKTNSTELKNEDIKEEKINNIETLLIEQIKELKEQMKIRDEKIEELSKNISTLNKPIEEKDSEEIINSNLSSVYKDIEIISKQAYTPEEAELEFSRRLDLLRMHRGTPSEQLYWGNKPTDMWAAEYLHSRGHIKTLKDFYNLRSKAALKEEGFNYNP